MRILTISLLIILFCSLGSCALYQKPKVPVIKTPAHFTISLKSVDKNLKDRWWENFHDNRLNQLVSKGLNNNYNYQIAVQNIAIAKTYVAQNKSSLYPQVNLGFNAMRNKTMNIFNRNVINSAAGNVLQTGGAGLIGSGQLFNLEQLAASVSYEVDVWNKIGNSVYQAEANVHASEADSKVVKLTLVNDMVNTYFQWVTTDINLDNLKEQETVAQKIWQLANDQYKSGLTDFNAVEDALNQLESVHTLAANILKQRQKLQNTLAYLAGEYPETFILKSVKTPCFLHSSNSMVPNGLPSKMLANRPDIQEAWFQMMGYGYLEKQTLANFLPSFSLTGNYGYGSQVLANLVSSGNAFWSIGASLMQPVFNYQLLKSEHERAKLQFQSAMLNYKNTVLNAFNEVDSALVSYRQDNESLLAMEKALHTTKGKLTFSDSQYRSGLVDYSSYLTLRLTYLQSYYNVVNQKLALINDITQVYKTLGIGLEIE